MTVLHSPSACLTGDHWNTRRMRAIPQEAFQCPKTWHWDLWEALWRAEDGVPENETRAQSSAPWCSHFEKRGECHGSYLSDSKTKKCHCLWVSFYMVLICYKMCIVTGQRSQWAMIRVCVQNLRVLENSLEKSQFKCKEAKNIMIDYLKLKSHLQVSPAFLVNRKTLSAPSHVTVCVKYFWNSHCKAGLWKWLFWSSLSA